MQGIHRSLLPIAFAILGALVAARMVPAEQAEVVATLSAFPEADPVGHQLRPYIIGILCFLPTIAAIFYSFSNTLARYLTRQFLMIFGICYAGFAIIWLLLNFQDNVVEAKQSGELLMTSLKLAKVRVPEISINFLPYTLLLSLLYSLGKLSKNQEIVAMLQTGRSLVSITFPLIFTGIFCFLFCMGLNYYWAPRAHFHEKQILDAARGLDESAAKFVMFRNPRSPRLWMVNNFPKDWQKGTPLMGIRVVSETSNGALSSLLVADNATYDMAAKTWSFANASLRKIIDDEPPRYVKDLPNPYVVKTWRETPAEIIQPGLPTDQLGVPDLNSWLQKHGDQASATARAAHITQWHYRFAQPFTCIVIVLLSIPLGIVFSRRAATGGVVVAVFLAITLLFLTTIFINLGQSGNFPPILAAWLPNLLFLIIAFYLFQRRLAGRPIYQSFRRLIHSES